MKCTSIQTKRILLLVIGLSLEIFTYAQIVNIPDAQFKTALLNNYPVIDTNGNGEIELGEALAVQSINIASKVVGNITGIKSFANLKSFNCSYNHINNMDLSGMDSLQDVQCNSVDFFNAAFATINVSNCSSLQSLSSFFNETTSINLTNCISLKTLDLDNNLNLTVINRPP